MEVVTHLVLFGLEIALVDLVGFDDDGDGFLYVDAMGGQTDAFGGVVGDETDVGGAEVAQDLRADAVVAFVGLEA